MITQAFNIDLVPGFRPQARQTAQQGDNGGSRVFSIAIENAGLSFAIPDEATVVILGTKPSGKGFSYDTDSDPDIIAKTETGVTVALSAQMTCVPGDVVCGLIIKLGAETLGSASFVMDVHRRALAEDTIIDRDDFSSALTAAVWDLFNELTEEQAAQIRDKLGIDEGGSGGSSTVIVTIEDTTDPPTASMTAAEIKAAVDAKERVVARYMGVEVPFTVYIDKTACFSQYVDFGGAPVTASILVSETGNALVSTTDIATADDIPTVPQMATQTDMSDWTSGKTVDASAVKAVFSDASTVILANSGDIDDLKESKADKAEIPTEVLRYVAQTLTEAEKAQARQNIGAASIADLGTVFTLKGGVATVNDLPQTGNRIGDVWYVESVSAGFIWITSTAYPDGYWEELGETVDLSAYAEKTWVQNQGYQTAQQVSDAISTAVSGKADKVPRVAMTAADKVVTIQPNVEYVFPEMAELRVTLGAITDDTILNEFHFFFYSGATPTLFGITGIKNGGELPYPLDANKLYEFSSLEGVAILTPHTLDEEVTS